MTNYDEHIRNVAFVLITFILIIGLAITVNVREKYGYTKGLEEGIKLYQIEAVQKSFGKWNVEIDGKTVTFEWIE